MKQISLLAFKNKQSIKDHTIQQLEAHYAADEIIKGTYWENGEGCAVGCTIHSGYHLSYETELGLPVWLAYLEEYLFEYLPNNKAKKFPLKLIKAIPVGFTDWIRVYHELCIYLFTDIIKTESNKKVTKVVEDIITLHTKAVKGEIVSDMQWSAVRSAVESAAESTRSAVRSAAVRSAAVRSAARSAAESTRSAARSAAESTRSAVWSATWLATWSAESAVRSAAIENISNKLIELLEKK